MQYKGKIIQQNLGRYINDVLWVKYFKRFSEILQIFENFDILQLKKLWKNLSRKKFLNYNSLESFFLMAKKYQRVDYYNIQNFESRKTENLNYFKVNDVF